MNKLRQFLMPFMAMLVPVAAQAYNFSDVSNGATIYYDILSSADKTVEVTCRNVNYNSYSGNIVIPETVTNNSTTYTVTSIGWKAFYKCSGLTSVTIPSSVTSINGYAFCGCSGLTSVTIPNSVTLINAYAFYGCSGLTSVTIPNSVTSINEYAFYGCSGLKSILIGSGVLSLGSSVFGNLSDLYKVILLPNTPPTGLSTAFTSLSGRITYVANENYRDISELGSIKKYDFLSSYFDVDGVRYVPISPSERTCAAIDCTYDPSVENITIGETVSSRGVILDVIELNRRSLWGNKSLKTLNVSAKCNIGEYFAATAINLEFISLSNSGAIWQSAFYGCTGLKSLTIGNTVTSIGNQAFWGAMTQTTEGEISLNNTGYINNSAFYGCTGLKTLTIGNTVTSIGSEAFRGAMTQTAQGEISLNNTGPIYYSAFYGCTGLKTLTIGNTVTSIYSEAFRGAMTQTAEGEISLNNTGYIGSSAFYGCTGLKTASLAETITKLDASCFYGCTNLQSINIPNKITVIPKMTFYNCSSLKAINLPDGLNTIQQSAFYGTGLTSVTIPAATKSIADGAFYNCKSLAEFIALDGSSTLSIGYSGNTGVPMFASSPLREVVIGRNLQYYTDSKYGYSPFYRNTKLQKVTLTDIPTEVFTNEFYGCTGLKGVSIGDGMTKMGDYAFSGCSSLETFSFGANVKTIGAEAFSDCTALTKLYAKPETPPTCASQALDDINKWNCTLYVPETAINAYRVADQWKEFFFVEGYSFSSGLEDVIAGDNEDVKNYIVYDLNGVLRMATTNKSEISALPTGVYIVNGKKVLVK